MTAPAVDEPWFTRPATSADHTFVWETTLMVRRPHGVPVREWWELKGPSVTRLLAANQAMVLDGGAAIIGFVVVSPEALEMLFVKRDYRGNGFGLRLLRDCGRLIGDEITVPVRNPTPSFRRWAQARRLKWVGVR